MKRFIPLALGILILALPLAATAADFPTKPIRIISPFAAGDAIDNTARVMAERMRTVLNVQVIVQNIPGGGGAVGLAEASRAAPDGYTLAIASTGALTAGPIITDSGFTPSDFTPLAQLVTMPLAVAVPEKSPYTSLKELVEAAKTKDLTYSTPGASTKQRIVMTQFAKDNGLKLIHVAGKGGTDAATKAMTGEVDFVFTALPVFENLARAKKLIVLAVSAEERVDYMPDVHTFKEEGYPTLDSLWFGLLVRKGVPADIVAKLESAIKDAVTQKETKELYAKLRFTDSYLDSPGFAKVIEANLENHKVVLKEIGLIK